MSNPGMMFNPYPVLIPPNHYISQPMTENLKNKNSKEIQKEKDENADAEVPKENEKKIIESKNEKKMNSLKKNAEKLNQDLINQNQRNALKNQFHATKSADQERSEVNEVINSSKGVKNNSEEIGKKYDEKFEQRDKRTESDISPEFMVKEKENIIVESEELGIIYHLNAHVHFSFKHEINGDILKKLKYAIKKHLKVIQEKVNQIKEFKIIFNDNNLIPGQIVNNNHLIKISNESSLSSHSSILDSTSINYYQTILYDVLENCLIGQIQSLTHKNFQNQTIKTIHKLLKSIPFKTPKEIKANFFKIFNIQIPMKQETFNFLPLTCQIKIYIYFLENILIEKIFLIFIKTLCLKLI